MGVLICCVYFKLKKSAQVIMTNLQRYSNTKSLNSNIFRLIFLFKDKIYLIKIKSYEYVCIFQCKYVFEFKEKYG